MPMGVGAVWASERLVPTVPVPRSSSGATDFQQAFSISAATAGVASTGSSPLPTACAVFSVVTRSAAWPLIPGSNICHFPFVACFSFYYSGACGGLQENGFLRLCLAFCH